ncbi:MAG: aldo/keto reductase [Rickettsiales bacterium]|nr:aldo/keto reductase [Rickettsiales bacterium]
MSYSPKFIYGSEKKSDENSNAIQNAIRIGFRAIDTANCCAYEESKVGMALDILYKQGYNRSDFWLQSKFTFMYPWFLDSAEAGEKEVSPGFKVPGYSYKVNLVEQIMQSLNNSLDHLNTSYLDSYILHGSFEFLSDTLHEKDIEAWSILEELYTTGKVKAIGVSNYSFKQIKDLQEIAKIQPMIIQNYFGVGSMTLDEGLYRYWDIHGRDQYNMLEFCKNNHIEYQGIFNVIADSKEELVLTIADIHNVSAKQVAFRFAYQSGVVPLTGTQNTEHMQQNIDIFTFELSEAEMQMLGQVELETHNEL